MTSFIFKIFAVITMFIDHLSYTIYSQFSSLNYVGRLAFPLFAFGISEGYAHTRNKKNYLLRLFMFGVISQAPYMFFNSFFKEDFYLNIFFTLFLGLLAIIAYEKCDNKWIGILLVACLGIVADTLRLEYGYFGIYAIFIFHIFKEKKLLMNFAFISLCILKYLPLFIFSNFYYGYALLAICTMASLIFINLYNGKKGKNTKYLLYAFYPAHLMILYVIHVLFF